jgi:hypothetical protein
MDQEHRQRLIAAAETIATQFISLVKPSSRAATLPVSPRNWIVAWLQHALHVVNTRCECQRRSGRYNGTSIARRPASVILYRRTSISLPPARTVSAATVAHPTRKNSATIFAVISSAISAASVTPCGPVFARSSRIRRRSSLRGIALSYRSV